MTRETLTIDGLTIHADAPAAARLREGKEIDRARAFAGCFKVSEVEATTFKVATIAGTMLEVAFSRVASTATA